MLANYGIKTLNANLQGPYQMKLYIKYRKWRQHSENGQAIEPEAIYQRIYKHWQVQLQLLSLKWSLHLFHMQYYP